MTRTTSFLQIAGLGLLVAIALLIHSLAVAAPVPKGVDGGEASQKFELRHTYKVGERLLIATKVHQESPWQQGRDDIELVSTTTKSDIAVSVAAGERRDEKILRMTFHRVRHHATKDGEGTVVDSANPAGADPNNLVMQLHGRSFDAVLDNGQIRDMEGVEALVQSQGKLWPTREHGVRVWNDALKAILLEPIAHLPNTAVRVGDTWKVRRPIRHLAGYPPVHSLPYVEMNDLTECKLVRVDETKEGRIAVIRISGKLGVFTKSGESRLNIDRQSLLSHRLVLRRTNRANLAAHLYRVSEIVAETRIAKDGDENEGEG